MTPSNQDSENPPRAQDAYANTERDEGTLGNHRDRKPAQAGLADEDQPQWAPPESQPEPRPKEPILSQSQPTPINTNSPA